MSSLSTLHLFCRYFACVVHVIRIYVVSIDRLRKTGDAAGHKTDPCGAGNDHFFCPTGTGPKDITARIKSSIIP